jgi:hypothetical protein
VDQNVKSDTSAARAEATVDRARPPGARKEDWIANQLRRVYDDALHEDIPKEMLDLLSALDEQDADEEDRG